MKLSPQEKKEFFALAQEKGYLSEEFIAQWDFLSLEEFVANKSLSIEHYRELLVLIKGEEEVNQHLGPEVIADSSPKQQAEIQEICDIPGARIEPRRAHCKEEEEQQQVEKPKEQEEKQEFVPDKPETKTEKRRRDQKAKVLNYLKKRNKVAKTSDKQVVAKKDDLAYRELDKEWKQRRVQEVEEALNQQKSLATRLKNRVFEDSQASAVAWWVTLLIMAIFFSGVIRLIFVSIAGVVIFAATIYYLQMGQKLAECKKPEPQEGDEFIEEVVTHQNTFIENLPTAKERIRWGGIVMVMLSFNTFSIGYYFQPVVAFLIGMAGAHLIEKTKGVGGAVIYSCALLCYLIISQAIGVEVLVWLVESRFGLILCALAFLFASTFGFILSENIEKHG